MDILLGPLLSFVLWWICLPLIWIVSSPIILIASLIKRQEGGFLSQVKTRYRNLTDWWEDVGGKFV